MTNITYTAQSPEQADAVLEVRARMLATGHESITVDPPSFPGVDGPKQPDGRLYVTGYKPAALDRCALVHTDGQVEWVR